MKKNKIIFLLAIIFLALLFTSSKANAGACIYLDRNDMSFYCENSTISWCFFALRGQYYEGQMCCQWEGYPLKTYSPNVQQGCCSKDNTCTSGVIDMGYYANCLVYQCNEGNYECNNGTCETVTTTTTEQVSTTTTIQPTTTTAPPTAIELSSFNVTPNAIKVILEWETETEIDNAGFNLYRSETEDGNYIKINDSLIPAQGSTTQGATYEYVDAGLKNKKTYYYKLEDIDLKGTSTMHGPVSAMPRLIYGIGK
jgi:hypothetical protein